MNIHCFKDKEGVVRLRSICFIILLTIFLLNTTIFAGNTGKVAGRIFDKQTQEPLIGANVFIEGLNLGAASDEDGFYYILQVPPGKHNLVVNYIGYHKLTIKEVRVQVDLTTHINIAMESETIEGPTIEVIADQLLIQKDITSTRRTTSRETIDSTPGIENTADVFKLQSGAFISTAPQTIQLGEGFQLQVRDESIRDVHIRGGRGGEILFMVDGMPVTHPLYGGREVLELNVVDVEEVELLTGAFSAEYGQAQSGVVNITTRSGSNNKFEGGIEYKTDIWDVLGDSYDTQYSSFYIGGPEFFTRNVLPKLGINIPGEMSFFLSANGSLTNTEHNNFRTREEFSLLGFDITEKQDNFGNLNAKVDWQLSEQFKIALSYHGSWKRWSSFNWLWKNYPDHTVGYKRNNNNLNIRFNHTISKSTFYNINIGYLGVDYNASLFNKKPYEFWTFYPDSVSYADSIGYDYQNYKRQFSGRPYEVKTSILSASSDASGFYDDLGLQNLWRDDQTSTFTFKGDISSQIHPEHLIKTGFEIQYHDIQYIDIQDGGTKLSNYGLYMYEDGFEIAPPPGPFPEFGQNRWVFNAFPLQGGFYVQDKFEKESLIINAGMRFDWFMPGESIFKNNYKQQWENATGLNADWGWLKYEFSPRFGISFPISERTVLFFSYGHFNQLPELQFYYRDPWSGGLTGNPHLDFEQTVLYEFGFTHQFSENWAVDIKSYAKDISRQVGTTHLLANLGIPVDLYDNKGYARAKGLEIEMKKRYSDFTSGQLTYTAQWATGYSSSAFEDYVKSINNFPLPIRERPVSWDIRHQIILQATVASPKGQPINAFGWNMPDNWNITVLSKFASGQPYTPGTTDPAEAQKKENTAHAPVTMTTDIKVKKTFDIGTIDLSFFVDIFNLFDQKNVNISYGFNPWTGQPYKYGDINKNSSEHEYFSYWDMYRIMDPRQFNQGRYAKFGLRIDW